MSGRIASFKPGDKVRISYIREGKEYTADVVLKGEVSKVEIASAEILGDKLGAILKTSTVKKLRNTISMVVSL